MGRGSISGTRDAPEVKPSEGLKRTLPEPLQSPDSPRTRQVEHDPAERKDSLLERLHLGRLRRSQAPS
jgi:hypothetical protein